jgi:glycosyltransferase involved in cell wall biosynthesis
MVFATASKVKSTAQKVSKNPLYICFSRNELTHYEADLCQHIARKGIKVCYVTFGSNKTYWKYIRVKESNFFSQRVFNAYELPLSRGSEKFSLPFCRLLINEQFDIVVLQLGSFVSLFYSIIARLAGSKVVWHITIHKLSKTVVGRIREIIIRGSRVLSKDVVTLTDMHKRTLLKLGFSNENIFTIPHSVDVNCYVSDVNYCLKTSLGLNDKKVILYIGRLAKEKGLIFLIQAMKLVVKNVPGAYLLIIGEGPLREALRQNICEAMLQDFARIDPPVPSNEVPQLFSICDIHVAPSIITSDITEAFGVVYLEAMASSKPSVAFDISAPIRNIISNGTTGYLVEEGNVNELAEKICFLLEHENARLSIGRKAKQKCDKYYNSEIVAQKWCMLLIKMNLNGSLQHLDSSFKKIDGKSVNG